MFLRGTKSPTPADRSHFSADDLASSHHRTTFAMSVRAAGVDVCTRQKPKMNNHIFCVVHVTRNGNTRPDTFISFFCSVRAAVGRSFFSPSFSRPCSQSELCWHSYNRWALCALPPWRKILHKHSKEFLFTHANRCVGHFMCVASESFRVPIYYSIFFLASLFFRLSFLVPGWCVRRLLLGEKCLWNLIMQLKDPKVKQRNEELWTCRVTGRSHIASETWHVTACARASCRVSDSFVQGSLREFCAHTWKSHMRQFYNLNGAFHANHMEESRNVMECTTDYNCCVARACPSIWQQQRYQQRVSRLLNGLAVWRQPFQGEIYLEIII